jgi:hypothetical protein
MLITILAPNLLASPAPQSDFCYFAITEFWPSDTTRNPTKILKQRKQLLRDFNALLNAAYRNGGYVHNPRAFPFAGSDFRGDHIIAAMRGNCALGRMYLRQLLAEYERRKTTEERKNGPRLVLVNRPATEIEARCGFGATSSSCP